MVSNIAVSSAGIALSIFNEIFIFDGEHFTYASTISFESYVEVMAWCPSSQFLVIGDNSGSVHFFSYVLGSVIHTTTLTDKTKEQVRCFAHCVFRKSENEETVNLTILSYHGLVFVFKKLPLPEISRALELNDHASFDAIKENIVMESFSVADVHPNTYFCTPSHNFLCIAGTGDVPITVWDDQIFIDMIDKHLLNNCKVIKCEVTADGNYLLVLHEESTLSVFDAEALIVLSTYGHGVKDFLLTSGSASGESFSQVVVLDETVDGKCKIEICRLPDFQNVYSKEISGNCYLGNSNLQESIHYIEDCNFRLNNKDVKGLTLKCLSEASPEHRIYSLIRKKKFDAAVQFSKVFGLDSEFVFKAKASSIVASVSSKTNENDSVDKKVLLVNNLIDDLEETLQNLVNIDFIAKCCLAASPPNLRQTHRILCIAKDRISKVASTERNERNRVLNEVLFTLNRLETFQMVFGESKFSSPIWRSFSKGDMLHKVTQALSEGNLSTAAIIWVRHHFEFERHFTSEKLQSILSSLRIDISSSSIVSWLKLYLVPFVIGSINDRRALYVLASWIEQRVVSLELSEMENWPMNGIAMARVLLDICKDKESSYSYLEYPTSVVINQDYGSALVRVSMNDSQANPVSSLAKLIENLNELMKLKVSYQCKLPLAEFTNKTPTEIMFKMLDCVMVVSLIPNVINNQIAQYGLQHGFCVDEVLVMYINKKRKQVFSSGTSNTLHEDRFVEITNCIKGRSKRMEAILLLMSWASVPWCSSVNEMVNTAMLQDPSNSQLIMGYHLMEMKKMLKVYGIRNVELSCDLHMKNVVRYILTTSHETALQDSLRIVEIYQCMSVNDVYVTRLRNLCLKGLSNECATLLVGIDELHLVSVVQYFLKWIILVVDIYEDNEYDRNERQLVIEAGIHTLEFLENTGLATDELKTTHKTLKNIHALEQEFSVFISYGEYQYDDLRQNALDVYLEKYNACLLKVFKANNENQQEIDQLFRLANLFGVSRVLLLSKILLLYPNNLNPETNIIFAEWYKLGFGEISFDDIMALCHSHVQLWVSTDDCVTKKFDTTLHELTSRLVTNCETTQLDESLELWKICWLSTIFFKSCDNGDLCLSSSVCEEDLVAIWNKAGRFQDNGFVLDLNTSFPLFGSYVKASLTGSKDPKKHLGYLLGVCRDLVSHFEENNLHELALHCSLFILHKFLIFVTRVDHRDLAIQEDDMKELRDMALYEIRQITSKLLLFLSKMLRSSAIDQSLIFAFLTSIPEEDILLSLKNDFALTKGRDPSRAVAVFNVFLDFAKAFCSDEVVAEANLLYSDALWLLKLKDLAINDGNLLIGETRDTENILKLLLEKPGIDVSLIIDFCNLFSLDVSGAVQTYISSNLAIVTHNICGEQFNQLKYFEENFVKGVEYLRKNSKVSRLLCLLKEVLFLLPMYDYERLTIVLHEVLKISSSDEKEAMERQLEVLRILKDYSRISKPSDYERHFKETMSDFGFKEQDNIPKYIATTRLPFHPLFYGKPWKVISLELNDETVLKLLRLCHILKMQEDQVYVTAAQNVVSCSLDNEEESPTSNFVTNGNFEKAVNLLTKVKNHEVSVKTGLTIISKWPQSEERVKAAHYLVSAVANLKTVCKSGTIQHVDKVLKICKDLYQEISIQHVLHCNGITDEVSLSYRRKPAKLIFHLYETYGCVVESKRPDIHKIADEIAAVSNVDVAKVRRHILATWQSSSSSRGMRLLENCTKEPQFKDQENLQRVVYLLQADSLQKNALFLLNSAYCQDPSNITYENRVRAMKLLFNIASEELIELVANNSIHHLKQYMKSLFYLSELENLHLSQTVESFQRCNKEGLVKGIWKNHKDNRNAILLIADICLDSEITEPQIWNNILRQLMRLGLTSYLINLLPRLMQFPSLWVSSNLVKIWTELAVNCLHNIMPPLITQDKICCQRSLNLLQKCPIMIEVVSISLFDRLLELELHLHALACLTLLPKELQLDNLSRLMSRTTPEKILDLLTEEKQSGQCFVDTSISQALIFEYLDSLQRYDCVYNSEQCYEFANYLIGVRNFPNFIMAMIKCGKLDSAMELVQHYDMYSSPLETGSFHFDDKLLQPGLNVLVVFLEKFHLLEESLPFLPEFSTRKSLEEKHSIDEDGDTNIIPDMELMDFF